jgi:hypothetical protein
VELDGDPDGTADPRRPYGHPSHEMPVAVGLNLPIARSDAACLSLTVALVSSAGVEGVVLGRGRPLDDRDLTQVGLDEVLWGSRPATDGQFFFGLELAGGQRLSSSHGAEDAGGFSLSHGGSSSGTQDVEYRFWLTPLPQEGPVTVVVACPLLGIPETRTSFDSAVLHAARREVVELWPEDSPRPASGGALRPELPVDSWFVQGGASG